MSKGWWVWVWTLTIVSTASAVVAAILASVLAVFSPEAGVFFSVVTVWFAFWAGYNVKEMYLAKDL